MIQHEIQKLFIDNKLTLSVAESCTGGQISHLLTTVPGSSNYYLGSVTSYAIDVKVKVLGVDRAIIDKYGVVSSQVAEAMARGVRELTGSDFAVATTGLAGPGSDGTNPEGTVWIGISSKEKTTSIRKIYDLGREKNIEKFATVALEELKSFTISQHNK